MPNFWPVVGFLGSPRPSALEQKQKMSGKAAMHNTFPVGVDQLEAYPVEL
jgi:hypothetical protein